MLGRRRVVVLLVPSRILVLTMVLSFVKIPVDFDTIATRCEQAANSDTFCDKEADP